MQNYSFGNTDPSTPSAPRCISNLRFAPNFIRTKSPISAQTKGKTKNMLLIPKLRVVLSAVFILTGGVLSVAAQNPRAAGRYPTSTILGPVPTSELKKAEVAKPATAVAVNSVEDKTEELNRDASNLSDSPSAPGDPTVIPPQTPDPDKWEFQVSPYFWLAGLHGTAGVGNRTTQVEESFSDVFHSLDFALMGVFEARKDKFVILVDTEYVAVSDDRATPGPLFSDLNAKFKLFIFDPEVGYRVFANPEKGQFIDVLGGVRVWRVSTEFDFGAGILPATQVQGSRTWVDGIAGLRGGAALSPKFFVTGKFDLGGGGSNFTYQLFGGVGYNVNPKIALIFGYRALDVNYRKDNFIYDMNQRGPILGAGFRF
jgi:opacity protein-like surface antigen